MSGIDSIKESLQLLRAFYAARLEQCQQDAGHLESDRIAREKQDHQLLLLMESTYFMFGPGSDKLHEFQLFFERFAEQTEVLDRLNTQKQDLLAQTEATTLEALDALFDLDLRLEELSSKDIGKIRLVWTNIK